MKPVYFVIKKQKKHRSKRLPLHVSNKKDENEENFTVLIEQVKKYDNSKIHYHRNCLLDHFYKVSPKRETSETHWHEVRQHHQAAFDEMCAFIKENIIQKGRCYFLTYLHRYYMELFGEKVENSDEIIGNFTPQKLESKIVKSFDKEMKFLIVQNKKLLAPKHLTAIDNQSFEQLKEEDILLPNDISSFTDHDIQQDMFNTIQKFICDVYNVNEIIDVDAARLQLFINSYTVSSVNEEFHRKNIKNFEASNLPPCKSELLQQFRRANYIASIWNNANTKLPSIFTPENNGWTLKENQYHFNWFDGDQLPAFVSESLQEDTEKAASVDNGDDDDDWNVKYQHWLDDENSNNTVDDDYED
ncbi:unnamed protein product [Ceutorhynchus assimilis]|uniref:Uncharacterized protein n=1 Tax=Ceutorhynchus assimilis TaxID=467358 RepID=A0A9N9QN07_9CUCU|nr:unnamed protein product [Ceutorhynchus assimilis]